VDDDFLSVLGFFTVWKWCGGIELGGVGGDAGAGGDSSGWLSTFLTAFGRGFSYRWVSL
jgi:hypothetical protein